MITLSAVHYVFIFMSILIMVALLFKKEIVLPCIIGILLVGLVYTHDIIGSIQILNNSLIASSSELFSIILVIAVITAMSKAMHSAGIDELMIRPVRKIIKTPKTAFWIIGIVMLISSWLIWPSPAVALVGALLLPVAGAVGLPAIWAAVAMNIFGHGMGLSSDFFIQGAPAITSKAAGIDITELMKSSVVVWVIMSVTVVVITYIMMSRDIKARALKDREKTSAAASAELASDKLSSDEPNSDRLSSDAPNSDMLSSDSLSSDSLSSDNSISENENIDHTDQESRNEHGVLDAPKARSCQTVIKRPILARVLSGIIIIAFAAIIIVMLKLNIVGGDATALITGSALILTCIITLSVSGVRSGLSDIVDYIIEGFTFSVKIFAPVIVIAAFFFLGSQEFAQSILGDNAPAILNDISLYLSSKMPMNKAAVVIIEVLVGIITGLDGSGFSGLPLVGSVASTLAASTGCNTAILASLGQITTVWVGGGTIIPWAVVPVAAICGISPNELARRNLIPVLAGIAAASVATAFLI